MCDAANNQQDDLIIAAAHLQLLLGETLQIFVCRHIDWLNTSFFFASCCVVKR